MFNFPGLIFYRSQKMSNIDNHLHALRLRTSQLRGLTYPLLFHCVPLLHACPLPSTVLRIMMKFPVEDAVETPNLSQYPPITHSQFYTTLCDSSRRSLLCLPTEPRLSRSLELPAERSPPDGDCIASYLSAESIQQPDSQFKRYFVFNRWTNA